MIALAIEAGETSNMSIKDLVSKKPDELSMLVHKMGVKILEDNFVYYKNNFYDEKISTKSTSAEIIKQKEIRQDEKESNNSQISDNEKINSNLTENSNMAQKSSIVE